MLIYVREEEADGTEEEAGHQGNSMGSPKTG